MKKSIFVTPVFFSLFLLFYSVNAPFSPNARVSAACPAVSMVDTTQGNMAMGAGAAGLLHDAVTASLGVTSVIQLKVSDRYGNYTANSNGNALNFSLNTVAALKGVSNYSGYQNGDKITYTISFNGGCGTVSTSAVSFINNAQNPLDAGCQSQPGEILVGTNSTKQIIELFTGDTTNRCSASKSGNTAPQILQVDPNGPFYNQDAKDFQVLGCGLNRDSVIYYPHSLGNGNVVFVTTNGCGSGSGKVYALYWSWVSHVLYKKIDPLSVRVIPVLTNVPAGVDMELDEMNGGNPLYFWVTENQGRVWRIPWSKVDGIVAPWITSINKGGNTPGGSSVSVINASQCPNCLFEATPNSNGIKVLSSGNNGYVYVGSAPNGATHGDPSIDMYNAKGNPNTPATVITVPLDKLQGVNYYGQPVLRSQWFMDGMTTSPDNQYLYVATNGGSIIWVFDVKDPAHPKLIGPAITNVSCFTNSRAFFDGIEIDPSYMMYVACGPLRQTGGIYTMNTNDINQAALANRDNGSAQIFKGEIVAGHTFISGDSYDDIAPLSGPGSMYQSYTPYYQTRDGSAYSYGGYSISSQSNDASTASNAYFTSDLLISQVGSNNFKAGATGSNWGWNFKTLPLSLNRSASGGNAAVYNHDTLYDMLCFNNYNACKKINSFKSGIQNDTITKTDNQVANNVYTYTPASGTLTIDLDNNGNGGLNENGILFVNKINNGKNGYTGGNVHIIVDRKDDWSSNSKRFLIIAAGNVVIDPAPTGGSSSSVSYQYMDMSVYADGTVTFNPYSGFPPQYPQPMLVKGSILAWGRDLNGNLISGPTMQFLFDAGLADEFDPAVKVSYDTAYLLNFSKFFPQTANTYEIGL